MQKAPKTMIKIFMKLFARQMGFSDRKRMKKARINDAVRIERNVPYVEDGNKGHLLDIFYPEQDSTDGMLVIDIHGGGLFYGYKEINEEFNLCLAERGCHVISLNYGLAPDSGFIEQIQDILHAYHWIYEHQEELGYDREHVCTVGDSAGALLAFYAAAINQNTSMQKIFEIQGSPLTVRALGLISGMFYLNKKDYIGRLHPVLFHGNYRESAYLPYINPRRVIAECILPPCFLVTSEEDMLKDYTMEFNAALEHYHRKHQMHCWTKGTTNALIHVFSVSYPEWEESRQTLDEMMEYFKRCCIYEKDS